MKLLIGQSPVKQIADWLQKQPQIEPIWIPSIDGIETPLRRHLDLQCVFLPDVCICCPQTYSFYKNNLKNIFVVCGSYTPKSPYPADIAYNAARVGKHLFCKISDTDPVILDYTQKQQLTLVNVAQGYTKCSLIPVSEKAIITADPSIAQAATANGFDVLFTTNDGILLPGYSNGFIGGTCAQTAKTFLFFGNLTKHRDFKKITHFLKKYGKDFLQIPSAPLTDLGSPCFIPDA